MNGIIEIIGRFSQGPGGVKQVVFQGSKRVPETGMVDKHSEVVREFYRTLFICASP